MFLVAIRPPLPGMRRSLLVARVGFRRLPLAQVETFALLRVG